MIQSYSPGGANSTRTGKSCWALPHISGVIMLQLPNDISYVFSGYAPLSVRLAHILHRPGWRSISEVLNLLPGPTTEEAQQVPGLLRKRRMDSPNSHCTQTHTHTLTQFLLTVVLASRMGTSI